jgi:hypothetical protein
MRASELAPPAHRATGRQTRRVSGSGPNALLFQAAGHYDEDVDRGADGGCSGLEVPKAHVPSDGSWAFFVLYEPFFTVNTHGIGLDS